MQQATRRIKNCQLRRLLCLQVTLLREAADQTQGFSGRELAKLMASVQSAAYATPNATLTPEIFRSVVQSKLKQHAMRQQLA